MYYFGTFWIVLFSGVAQEASTQAKWTIDPHDPHDSCCKNRRRRWSKLLAACQGSICVLRPAWVTSARSQRQGHDRLVPDGSWCFCQTDDNDHFFFDCLKQHSSDMIWTHAYIKLSKNIQRFDLKILGSVGLESKNSAYSPWMSFKHI